MSREPGRPTAMRLAAAVVHVLNTHRAMRRARERESDDWVRAQCVFAYRVACDELEDIIRDVV